MLSKIDYWRQRSEKQTGLDNNFKYKLYVVRPFLVQAVTLRTGGNSSVFSRANFLEPR